MNIIQLEELISNSQNIVCINGRGMTYDCGYPEYWTQNYSYYFENKYGKSMEEIYNIGFYSTRSKEFFEIYKEEILKFKFKPSLSYYKLAQLEKIGRLKCCITKGIFNLAQRAGCKNVIDIYGNVYDNICPKCGQRYSVDYMIQSKGLPKCLECNSAIRPDVKMIGELIDNNKVTKAMNAISTADMLLILDTGYNGEFKEYLSHYCGNKAVLIKDTYHESDKLANYIIYDKSKNVLTKLSDEKVHIIYDKLEVVNH
ncbi:NAD-dependent deacetylase [Lachnotalea glycerini]|uniref:protein acetyllysine N-acetyltransferase n=1 Tax=Lachnotalea glycerini TaxID=1763509 RepID=A0A318EH71_9FIRM|nr:Sir2 family NAD-dependent protein deacetylase [Lachnotalea glycerini]PXV85608.1 NAD-dependent deacetylase [Lachnotalea glycerini]